MFIRHSAKAVEELLNAPSNVRIPAFSHFRSYIVCHNS